MCLEGQEQSELLHDPGRWVPRDLLNLGITAGSWGRNYVPKMATSIYLLFHKLILQRKTDIPERWGLCLLSTKQDGSL